MAWLIGTDEAGYGPNLGPLVVSATLWRIRSERHSLELADMLAEAIADVISTSPTRDGRLVVADSKLLYKPGQGLAPLEANLLPLLALTGPPLGTWRQAFQQLAPDCWDELRRIPWYVDHDENLPCELPTTAGRSPADLRQRLAAAGVELCAVRSAVLFPGPFNQWVERLGNKASVLSHLTLQLIARLLEHVSTDEPLLALCDKHGGRNKYADVLQEVFPEYLVEIHGESAAASVYRWGPAPRRVEVRFLAKGERYPQTALASMASKYLRELAMRAFNRWWLERVPGLRPTAGYPVDALRFRSDVESAGQRLGIDQRMFWRSR
ncbi:MAG: hypothetical protein J5I93_21820 [Pirellulaceae bacterium]|nr:hypothetical protein [Pirellulaceae bacterium]